MLRKTLLRALPINSARGRNRKRNRSSIGREEVKKESQYKERSANSCRELIPILRVAKAVKVEKLKATPKSANLFKILAD